MLAQQQSASVAERVVELEREVADLRAVRMLAGGLAHDFNNLLTAIAGYASLLEVDAELESETAESAAAILKAAAHASAIAGMLQNFAGRTKTRRVPVDVHEVLRDVIILLKPSTNDNITVTQALNAAEATVMGDPEQLHQLFLNLAVNACDAMPHGGDLAIESGIHSGGGPELHGATPEGRQLLVSLRDTGRGIAAEDGERVFEPFFTTRGAAGGKGLGLTLVAGVVKKHRGAIRMESERGRGSTFHVSLPLAGAAGG